MRWLVTAGNTQAPIDDVRCITNIFSGRTGAGIAAWAAHRGHGVTLLTSQPLVVAELQRDAALRLGGEPAAKLEVIPYRTFDDLAGLMETHVSRGGCDVVVHSAAVSDYLSAGVYAPAVGTHFEPETGAWRGLETPRLEDVSAGKVTSKHRELWLRLVPAPKLVDRIRTDWSFRGILVKFKLEVGLADADLLQVGGAARTQSAADLLVANTLGGMHSVAWLLSADAEPLRIERPELAPRLVEQIEGLFLGRKPE